MRIESRRCLSTFGLALLAAIPARAACPDAPNNVPGCQLNSNADFAAFHLLDYSGVSTFDAAAGHAGPGSVAMSETTGLFVSMRGECFTPTYPAAYSFGGYLRPAPPTVASNCQFCLYLYTVPGCGSIDLVLCDNQVAALAPGWTRFESSNSTLGYSSAHLIVNCTVNDGGIVHVDDAFAGTQIFFDTFESNGTGTWSLTSP